MVPTRRRPRCLISACSALLAVPLSSGTLDAQGTRDDYRRAEWFLAPSADTLVLRSSVTPNWIAGSDRFWYRNAGIGTREYILVDPARGTRRPAFDHARLAASLSEALEQELRADDLPIDELTFGSGDTVLVRIRGRTARCHVRNVRCVAIERDTLPVDVRRSPDGRWIAFIRDHDLWVRSTATGEERALTTDGVEGHAYAARVTPVALMVAQGTRQPRMMLPVDWSPDSRRLVTYRMDTRRAGRLTMVQYAPSDDLRPRAFEYVYPLPIDSVFPLAEPVVFDVAAGRRIAVAAEPIPVLYYDGPRFEWDADNRRILYRTVDPGYTRHRLHEIDAESGRSRIVVEDLGDPYVDRYSSSSMRPIGGGNEILMTSERDGWNHLYVHDGHTGKALRRLTHGGWRVQAVQHIDTAARAVFFIGLGREKGRDPYLAHLYRVSLDGGEPVLLTPEHAYHTVRFSPTGAFFVDTYSRVDLPPVSVLRRSSDGRAIMELERADAARLLATGWRPPVPFTAIARDDSTVIHGLMWRPTNFDSTRSYPVVESVYTGPHGFFVPKDFAAFRHHAQAVAELGFITVMIDGLGTAGRSRAFHEMSYRRLGDGVADHPGAIRQLASRHPYLDLTRVGIFGHSAGGYDAVRAILEYGDFYDVAVASAADHDARLDKAVWNTQWMGYPAGDHYAEQSNVTNAHKLRGKLLLMHGDVDDNVPFAQVMRMAEALIRANRDFDLLIMPGEAHGAAGHPYFVRRRWDYFVRHLLGVEPPSEYRVGGPS